MDQKKYDVFISYSRKDYKKDDVVIPENIVSKVKDSFKAADISYWFDEEGIYSGNVFPKKIYNSIKASRVFVFIASKNANQSDWTRKEIATANEFKKPIIPFRVDDSHYDEAVFLILVDLHYIAHYKTPDTSLDELVMAVKNTLEEIKEKEEERRKQVEDEKVKEQQQKDIEAIRLACSKLNNEETKIEVDRSNLLVETKAKVKDLAEQEKLMNEIINSSPIQKSEQEIKQLKNKIESLENGLKSLQQEKESLSIEIQKNKGLVVEKEQLVTNVEQKYQCELERLENQVKQQQGELTETISQLQVRTSQLAKAKEQLSITEKKQTNSGMNGNRGFRW